MTQEDKQLLLKDLSARLPYGVKVDVSRVEEWRQLTLTPFILANYYNDIEKVKPYLRPMSSMTEEEKEELIKNFWGSDGIRDTIEEVDWYLSKHFDIRGLIEKGLAIEVTEKNNPYKG